MSDDEDEGGANAQPRIFVNQLDTYMGGNIAQVTFPKITTIIIF